MSEVKINLPPKLLPIFAPARGSVQYRAAKGGRGSGKSFNFAKMAATWGMIWPMRILCVREYQVSIKESFHAEVKSAISSEPWLDECYDVGIDYIRGKQTGTEFIFRGLRNSVKSLHGIDLTIVEEAEDVREAAWLDLEATVFRKPQSELWAIWNPRTPKSPVDARFVLATPENSVMTEMNWQDNPFFPKGLDQLRRREQERLDPSTYHHVWEGGYLTNSKSQIFANKYSIKEFTPEKHWAGPYQGGDFGFSQDPTVALRVWIDVAAENLYIEYEAGKVGLDLDDTGKFLCDRIPEFEKHKTRWDSARPESISHLKRPRQHVADKRVVLPYSEPVVKWKGSVEDGIEFLKSFKHIYVHPRCKMTIEEMRLYSYKVDRLTGDILTDIVDAHNHAIDALRYAIGPMIKRTGYTLFDIKAALG